MSWFGGRCGGLLLLVLWCSSMGQTQQEDYARETKTRVHGQEPPDSPDSTEPPDSSDSTEPPDSPDSMESQDSMESPDSPDSTEPPDSMESQDSMESPNSPDSMESPGSPDSMESPNSPDSMEPQVPESPPNMEGKEEPSTESPDEGERTRPEAEGQGKDLRTEESKSDDEDTRTQDSPRKENDETQESAPHTESSQTTFEEPEPSEEEAGPKTSPQTGEPPSPEPSDGETRPKTSPQMGGDEKKEPLKVFIPPLSVSLLSNPGRLMNASWFIMFFASWCEHSQAAYPIFLDVAEYMMDINVTGVYLGKIDVSKHGEVVKQFKIKSTPTFLFYLKGGTRYELEGEVTFENLKNFMLRILQAEVTRVNTSRQLAELHKTHPVLFLLAHDQEIDINWQSTYAQVAREKALSGRFLVTTDPDVVKDFHVTTFPSIIVIKDGTSYSFKEALSSYALTRWITNERYVAFPVVNATTMHPFLKPSGGRRVIVLVVDDDPSQRRIAQKKAIEVMKKIALNRELRQWYQLVMLESVEMAESMLQQSSLELPVLFAYESHTGYYYLYEPGESEKGYNDKSVIRFFKEITRGQGKRMGGPSYKDSLYRLWWRIYGTVQSDPQLKLNRRADKAALTMITHRPYLSLTTVFSVLAVSLFYLSVWCGSKPPKKLSRPPKRRGLKKQRVGGTRKQNIRRRGQSDEGSGSGTESQSYSDSEIESRKDK